MGAARGAGGIVADRVHVRRVGGADILVCFEPARLRRAQSSRVGHSCPTERTRMVRRDKNVPHSPFETDKNVCSTFPPRIIPYTVRLLSRHGLLRSTTWQTINPRKSFWPTAAGSIPASFFPG